MMATDFKDIVNAAAVTFFKNQIDKNGCIERHDWQNYLYSLQNNPLFIINSITNKINARALLKFASDEIKNNYSCVLKAVEHNGLTLQLASKALRSNKPLILAAVKQNGKALQYASYCSKRDKEIVLAAVKQTGRALIFADSELMTDNDILLAAVTQNGLML